MSYTTITDLPEKLQNDLVGSEYMLLADPDYSYKVSLNTINDTLLQLSAGSYQELTNKVIDNVSNYVHANAIHFVATASNGDIEKGQPVKLVSDPGSDYIYVERATGQYDQVIGLCEDGILDGETGEIMAIGILDGLDTSAFSEGALVYSDLGTLTTIQPTGYNKNFVGFVLNVSATAGKILVTQDDPRVDAIEIFFSGTGSNIVATNVEDALIELDAEAQVVEGRVTSVEGRVTTVENAVTDLQEIVFQQATAPTVAEGASDGDIWMDTTTNTLKVYREYPLGTGVYRWEPLLYKWDDTVDGGSW